MPRRFFHRHQTACLPCWAKAALGALAGLGVVALAGEASGATLLMAPLGASAMLLFGFPASPLSQPAPVIGGHLVAALVGLLFDHLLPAGWWSMAAAVAVAIAVMGILRLSHPPAAANPLVVMMAHPGWDFLLAPVLIGSIALVVIAVLIHRLPPRTAYPLPLDESPAPGKDIAK
jgi:CBS-domain-containing membrane protein